MDKDKIQTGVVPPTNPFIFFPSPPLWASGSPSLGSPLSPSSLFLSLDTAKRSQHRAGFDFSLRSEVGLAWFSGFPRPFFSLFTNRVGSVFFFFFFISFLCAALLTKKVKKGRKEKTGCCSNGEVGSCGIFFV